MIGYIIAWGYAFARRRATADKSEAGWKQALRDATRGRSRTEDAGKDARAPGGDPGTVAYRGFGTKARIPATFRRRKGSKYRREGRLEACTPGGRLPATRSITVAAL